MEPGEIRLASHFIHEIPVHRLSEGMSHLRGEIVPVTSVATYGIGSRKCTAVFRLKIRVDTPANFI